MLGKVAAKLATKIRGKKKPKAPHPSTLDHSENLKILAERKKAGLTPDGKPKRKVKKRKPDTKKQTKAGRLVAGAGDMSEPGGSGKFRSGQKSRRSSSATTSNHAMSTAESGRLARGKSARGSKAFYDQAVKDKAAGKKLNAAQKDILENYNKEMRPASPKRKVSKKKAEAAAKLKKFAGGGQMSRVGLSPAEEKRSGTMSEKKRAKNMQYGGKVKKYGHGGKVDHNTSRMNRLEELGRVDAEKAYTKKGKSNLRSEKKRIVKELNGNDFVARHYDS